MFNGNARKIKIKMQALWQIFQKCNSFENSCSLWARRDLVWLHKKRYLKENLQSYYLCFGFVRTLTPKFEKAASIGTLLTQYFSLLTELNDFCLQMTFKTISGTLVKYWSQGVHFLIRELRN